MSLESESNQLSRGQRIARFILLGLSIVLSILLVFFIIEFVNTLRSSTAAALEDAKDQVLQSADELDAIFGSAMEITEGLADDLSSGALPFDNESIVRELRTLIEARPDLYGISAAFAPNAFPSDNRLHLIYLFREADGEITIQIQESAYDYTQAPNDAENGPATGWYHDPIELGPTWQEPFFAEGAGRVLIEYGAPFSDPASEEVAGVVALDFTLEEVERQVDGLDLGQTGFGLLLNQSGTWLAHPVREFVTTRTFYESPAFMDDERLIDAAQRALQGETVTLERIEPQGEMVVWDVFVPVSGPEWVLAVELAQNEYLLDATVRLRWLTLILLTGGLLLAIVVALLADAPRATKRAIWITSVAYSIIAAGIIVAIIVLARLYVIEDGVAISSQAGLAGYVENLNTGFEARGVEAPIQIPTGMLLQSVRYPDATSVVINGFVWQHVPKLEGIELTGGFTLPQLIDEPMQVEEVHREESETKTLIVWTINAALKQSFDPIKYPFDSHDISIRLMPLDMQHLVVLVPDLGSYEVTAPSFLPGLDSTVSIRDWQIDGTAFRYIDVDYGTSLGIPGRPTRDLPELTYGIDSQRRFLGPFIAFLLPALVAAMMIFAFVLSDRKPDEPEEIVTALSYTAALFFVIAVMHTALRESAAAIGLTYLEYFYLLLYLMIIFVAINTFMVVNRPNAPVVRFGNNLVAKTLFWPVALTAMLIATVLIFV
jgi:hypothetical protein